MKFVNKLSVLSLVVLMFSFMNVSQAAKNDPPYCNGGERSCDDINKTNQTDDKKAFMCNNSYQSVTTSERATQCKWTKELELKIHNHNNSTAKAEAVWRCNDSGGPCRVSDDSTWR
jgi:hypothetical protein